MPGNVGSQFKVAELTGQAVQSAEFSRQLLEQTFGQQKGTLYSWENILQTHVPPVGELKSSRKLVTVATHDLHYVISGPMHYKQLKWQ